MKKALVTGASVLALGALAAGGAWVAGARLPEHHEIRLTVATRQGPLAVWRVVSDFEQQPIWREDLTSVERIDDIAGNPAWRETGSGGESKTLVTAAWSPPHSLQRDIVADGHVLGSWTVDLMPEGMGTRVTLIERARTPNPITRLVNHRFGGAEPSGATLLRSLADHLGDPQNQVVEVDEPLE